MSNELTWVEIPEASDLNDGEMIGLDIGDMQIAIYKVDGEFYATDNICTHAYALLTDGWLDSHIIECPLHGGQFNVCTGAALCDPVEKELKTYQVKMNDGVLKILVPGK